MISNVIYLVQCKELGIFKEFTDFDTAHTFATQLKQDYPEVSIGRFKPHYVAPAQNQPQ